MKYSSPRALEMALKSVARNSRIETSQVIDGFTTHRLLCRIFMGGRRDFVLKGGRSALARTIDARATRDVDLLYPKKGLDSAREILVDLVSRDLDDFMSFEFAGSRPIATDEDYRDGLSIRFIPYIGAKRMPTIVLDLVVDTIAVEDAEFVAPADRIEIGDLPTCDYLVLPIEHALADKMCALLERHGDRA